MIVSELRDSRGANSVLQECQGVQGQQAVKNVGPTDPAKFSVFLLIEKG